MKSIIKEASCSNIYFQRFYLIIQILLIIGVQSGFSKITLDTPDTLYVGTEYTLSSFFSDNSGSEADAQYWGWRIVVTNGDGATTIAEIDSLHGFNTSSWIMSIDTIPILHYEPIFIKGSYHKLNSALLIVYTTDSKDFTHTLAKQILLIGSKGEPGFINSPFIFIDTHDDEIHANSTVEFSAYYIDDGHTGYSEYWNWQLFLFNTNGVFILDKADSLLATKWNTSNWSAQVDGLPSNISFIRDSSGLIISFLTVNTTDTFNIYYDQIELLTFNEDPTSINNYKVKDFPKDYELFQNYPNPFNPSTTISFSLNQSSLVQLDIFNSLGQHIRTVAQNKFASGYYKVYWDGKDKSGNDVPSGVYIYSIKTNYSSQARKMLLLR